VSEQTIVGPTKEQRRVLDRLEKRRDRIVKLDAQLQEQYVKRSGIMCAARRVDPPVPVADICDLTGLTQAGYRYALRTWPCLADAGEPTRAKVLADLTRCHVRLVTLRTQRQELCDERRNDLLLIAALQPPVRVRDFCAAAGISEEMYRKIIRG
jgi:hypothetical protein